MPKALPREWYGDAIHNAGVSREKDPLGRRALLAWAGATAVLLCCLLLYVSQGLKVIRMGYEIDTLQDRYRALKAERGRLEVELASVRSLQAVEREAVEGLGMALPEPGQVIVIRDAGAGVPVAAGRPATPPALAAAR
jgi:cell division protein FtsL